MGCIASTPVSGFLASFGSGVSCVVPVVSLEFKLTVDVATKGTSVEFSASHSISRIMDSASFCSASNLSVSTSNVKRSLPLSPSCTCSCRVSTSLSSSLSRCCSFSYSSSVLWATPLKELCLCDRFLSPEGRWSWDSPGIVLALEGGLGQKGRVLVSPCSTCISTSKVMVIGRPVDSVV